MYNDISYTPWKMPEFWWILENNLVFAYNWNGAYKSLGP